MSDRVSHAQQLSLPVPETSPDEEPVSPGCTGCRLDLIRFTADVWLPRFTMHAGEEWSLSQSRYRADGSFHLGAGIVPAGMYVIVERDEHRASHNGLPCPGDSHKPVLASDGFSTTRRTE